MRKAREQLLEQIGKCELVEVIRDHHTTYEVREGIMSMSFRDLEAAKHYAVWRDEALNQRDNENLADYCDSNGTL